MPEHVQERGLQKLRDTVLIGMQYDVRSRSLILSFQEPSGSRVSVHLIEVLQLSVSNTDDPPLEKVDVVHVSARKLEDGAKQELDRLGYMWRDLQGKTVAYEGPALFHFLVEGDVCIAAICKRFDLRNAPQSQSAMA